MSNITNGWIPASRVVVRADPWNLLLLDESLHRLWVALAVLVIAGAVAVAAVAGMANQAGFERGVEAAEAQIEATVVEAYRQGQRDAQEAAYTCRGVSI
jgi:hypothetical protein